LLDLSYPLRLYILPTIYLSTRLHTRGHHSTSLDSLALLDDTTHTSVRSCLIALLAHLATLDDALSHQQTKKVVLRLECTVCKVKHQLVLKRTKHFELGGDKKQVSLGLLNKIAASVLTSFSEVPPSLSKLIIWIGNRVGFGSWYRWSWYIRDVLVRDCFGPCGGLRCFMCILMYSY
jgi:hypothetical protein